MLQRVTLIFFTFFLFFTSCSGNKADRPLVIMVSLDGFRWDYVDKAPAPNLQSLIDDGVKAKRMIPVFPSKTFPNHYTLVTGLYPANHGIVSNRMWDPDLKKTFVYKDSAANVDGYWWGGEPIWITAEKQGLKSASYYWVGSEVMIEGMRPSYYYTYDHAKPDSARVDSVLKWIDLPDAERPSIITLYFAHTDDVGHTFGPESNETREAITYIDGIIGRLITGLKQRGLFDRTNLIIVSDHGMEQLDPDKVIFLDDYVDVKSVKPIFESCTVGLWPPPESMESTLEKLKHAHPHLTIYSRDSMPPQYHYTGNARIPPIMGVADEGWSISTHDFVKRIKSPMLGSHGIDPRNPVMGATFIAHGPGFRRGFVSEPFENVHVYALLCNLLKITPAPNDGSLDSVRQLLAKP